MGPSRSLLICSSVNLVISRWLLVVGPQSLVVGPQSLVVGPQSLVVSPGLLSDTRRADGCRALPGGGSRGATRPASTLRCWDRSDRRIPALWPGRPAGTPSGFRRLSPRACHLLLCLPRAESAARRRQSKR